MNRVIFSTLFGLIIVSVASLNVKAQIESLKFEDSTLEKTEDSSSKLPKKAKIQNTSPDDLVHQGDLLDVDVVGSIEYDWRGTLTPEGALSGFSFTKELIYAACETPEHIAGNIAKEYESFLKNPKIIVTILDRTNRPVSRLYGAVNQPHRFRIKRKVFLNELLVLAGGITEKASGEIQILRGVGASCEARFEAEEEIRRLRKTGDEAEILKVSKTDVSNLVKIKIADLLKGKKEANPQIFYGDLITVLEAEPIYVIGAVENPTKIALRSELTVSRAISSSGGLSKGADDQNITIFRRKPGGSDVIKANLREIESGRADDVVLRPFDVVEVAGRRGETNRNAPIIETEIRVAEIANLPLKVVD